MITDLPTYADYDQSAVNLLHMAWSTAVGTLLTLDQLSDDMGLDTEGQEEAVAHYWRTVQPQLANALSLTQQAMELCVKARIARVSPYLLIANQPRDFPSGADSNDVSFTTLRTVDAIDLIRLHNTVCSDRLDRAFGTLFENSRVERNHIIHGGKSHTTIDPLIIIQRVVEIFETFHPDIRWADARHEAVNKDEVWGFGLNVDYTELHLATEFLIVVRQLPPAWIKAHFGFDKRQRAYICPHCLDRTDSDRQEGFPKLAQLDADRTSLYCFVCDTRNPIERTKCLLEECPADVMSSLGGSPVCMTCGESQEFLRRWQSPA